MASLANVNKLYMYEPKLYSCNASITFIGNDEKGRFLKLSQTIFHPQGGGQPFDLGTIRTADRSINVINVQKEIDPAEQDRNQFEIRHYILLEDDVVSIGDEVELSIDAKRRELNARLHSSGHLIAAVVEKFFPKGWKAVSGHHMPKEARVEFEPLEQASNCPKERVEEVLKSQLDKEITSDVQVQIIRDESGRRIQIGNYEAVPCGGTHVENLSEIGEILLKSVSIKSKKLRVSYGVLGE